MREGIDFTGDHSGQAAAIKRAGKTFVARYFTPDGGGLLKSEAEGYSRAGLLIHVVFEWEAARAKRGGQVGAPDARECLRHAARIGMPASAPFSFAVDFDGRGPEVASYFQAARNVLGVERTWAYGSHDVVKWLFDHGLIGGAWQTYAWSSGLWEPRAKLRQYRNDVTVAGINCDLDRALDDSGLWRVGGGTGDVVRTLVGGMRGQDVKALVEAFMWLGYLPYPVLGRPLSYFGGWVNTALRQFQDDHHYAETLSGKVAYGPQGRVKLAGTIAARKRAGWTPQTKPPLPAA